MNRNKKAAVSETSSAVAEAAAVTTSDRDAQLDSDFIPPAVESVEIDGHKCAVEEVDGK